MRFWMRSELMHQSRQLPVHLITNLSHLRAGFSVRRLDALDSVVLCVLQSLGRLANRLSIHVVEDPSHDKAGG